MTIATTQSERFALIKQIAERKKKMARIKTQSKKVMRKAPKAARTFMDKAEDTSKNPNYYTDSSKYAQQYYGETYYETTRHDTDWGDY